MKQYRNKKDHAIMVEAEQWFAVTYDREAGHGFSEKDLPIYHLDVGYFRDPEIDGLFGCDACGYMMHDHGFIDNRDCCGKICPESYMVKDKIGFYYPMLKMEFENTYELMEFRT